jgi:hypothetical protein
MNTGRIRQRHLFQWLGLGRGPDPYQFLLILRAVIQVAERAEAFTIEPQFLLVLVSRVQAVQQLSEEQTDFALNRATYRMHQPAANEDGPNRINFVLCREAAVVLRQRFGESIIDANNLFSNLHKALNHFRQASACV